MDTQEDCPGNHQPPTTTTTQPETAMQKLTIETPDGQGEAIKTDRNTPWKVTLPTVEFQFFAAVPEMKTEIRRVLEVQYGSESRYLSIELATT